MHGPDVKSIHIWNLDLEIYPSSERVFQRGGPEAASRTVGFFEHEMDGAACEVSEAFLRAVNQTGEPKPIHVKSKGHVEVGDVEFGYDERISLQHPKS